MKHSISKWLPGALAVTALFGCQTDLPPPPPAEAIWFNGPVITVDDNAPEARAVAVRDGRIVAVGEQDAVLRY